MPIIVSEPTSERGRKDARRHREKHKEAIKNRLPEIISSESIIGQRKGKVYKIPVDMLDIPHFRPGHDGDPQGLGQGEGEAGDSIGHKPGNKPGQPGEMPGVDYLEAEFKLEELIELMLEDLGLPKLEEKEVKNFAVELGWKISGTSKSGPRPLMNVRATTFEAIKRFWQYLAFLESETQKSQLDCFRALKQAEGSVTKALEILKSDSISFQADKVAPFPIFANEDLRFKRIEEDKQEQSNAVFIAMMDVSGSMSDMKKYLAKSIIFWLTEFLDKMYNKLEIRFIIHHTTAKLVTEENFFKTGESGGTACYAAYELANSLIETEYPVDRWNVYVSHFSDGEDFDHDKTVQELERLLARGINVFFYGEIQPVRQIAGPWYGGDYRLWKTFKSHFNLKERKEGELSIMNGEDDQPMLCAVIDSKEDILPVIKSFLKKDRWA